MRKDYLAATEEAGPLLSKHIAALNHRDENLAKQHLFHPAGASTKPLDIYVRDMIEMGPYRDVRTSVVDIEPPRQKRHGICATVWVKLEANVSALGSRSEDIPVWWFPDSGKMVVAARLSNWLEEWRNQTDA